MAQSKTPALKTIALFIFVLVLLTVIFNLPSIYPTGIVIYFRLALILLALFVSLKLFVDTVIRKKRSPVVANMATILWSFITIFLLVESVFMFIPKSHGYFRTLGARLWLDKYDNPKNSFGYRDVEPVKEDGERDLFFVGDSFTAGSGIKYVEQRFANIVTDQLKEQDKKTRGFIVGKPGLDTVQEYQGMLQYIQDTGIHPEVIVLQYFVNDIVDTARQELGKEEKGLHEAFKKMPPRLRLIIENSYFVNFMYWNINLYNSDVYSNFLKKCFTNRKVLSIHEAQLQMFIDYARKNKARLLVLPLPWMQDLQFSRELYLEWLVNFFQKKNIEIIDIEKMLVDLPVEKRVINNTDGHASVLVNQIIAESIIQRLN